MIGESAGAADAAAPDPMAAAVDGAACAVRALCGHLLERAPECVDELRDAVAVMTSCAWEASHHRGSIRRKLLEIARSKAARALAALDVAESWGVPGDDAMAAVRDALIEAIDALAPRRRRLWR